MHQVVRLKPRTLAAASIGNAIEYYDFLSYIFFASSIAAVFFPGRDETTKLLLTFGTFGVSFLARPVGAVVLGHYADRRGRVACMMLSIGLMTFGSLVMTVMPGYRAVGPVAPLGILLARLIQGFSLGGEYGSSTAFMIEQSRGGEARAAVWQGTSQAIAGAIALGVAWSLSTLLSRDDFQHWSFRIAFAIGVAAGPIALLLRREMLEAPAPASRADVGPARSPAAFATLPNICLCIGLITLSMGELYLGVYLPTYTAVQLHMSSRNALGAIFLLYVVNLLMTPLRLFIAGRFDRSRRINLMLGSSILLTLAGYPLFILLNAYPAPYMLLLVPFSLQVLGIFYTAPLPALMGAMFTRTRRGIGLSVSYALGVAIFGGFAPLIMTWLIVQTGDKRSPGLYLTAAGLITLVSLLSSRLRLEKRLSSGVDGVVMPIQAI